MEKEEIQVSKGQPDLLVLVKVELDLRVQLVLLVPMVIMVLPVQPAPLVPLAIREHQVILD
jgi:hypothetical protein